MRLVLVGPPGSGKGTQADLLTERLKLAYIGTGDILREAVQKRTEIGLRAEPLIKAGQLVPDDLVNELVAARFREPDRPECFVLDGYPRTLAQAASFDQVMRQQFMQLEAVVQLVIDDEEVVRRICGRWICPQCNTKYHLLHQPPLVPGLCDKDHTPLEQRPDDREMTIRERLRVFHSNTDGLVEYYRQQGLLREVSALGNVEQVYADILKATNHRAEPSC